MNRRSPRSPRQSGILSLIVVGLLVIVFILEIIFNILKLTEPLVIIGGCFSVISLFLAIIQAFPGFLQSLNLGGLMTALRGRSGFIVLSVTLIFSLILNILLLAHILPQQVRQDNGTLTPTLPQASNWGTPSAQEIKANPYPSYLTGYGILAVYDPLQNNSAGAWQEYSPDNFGGSCVFENRAYHVIQTEEITYCKGIKTDFRNFAFEVQMTIIKGDCGGILFDGDTSNLDRPNFFYQLRVCQDGTYQVLEGYGKTLSDNSSHAIHTGLKQINLLAVVVKDNLISVYVNGQQIDAGPGDRNISHGFIGVGAAKEKSSTEVIYQSARVWTLV